VHNLRKKIAVPLTKSRSSSSDQLTLVKHQTAEIKRVQDEALKNVAILKAKCETLEKRVEILQKELEKANKEQKTSNQIEKKG
jgi:uncharacterized protein involved in exopolysaccharide biosynthesis